MKRYVCDFEVILGYAKNFVLYLISSQTWPNPAAKSEKNLRLITYDRDERAHPSSWV